MSLTHLQVWPSWEVQLHPARVQVVQRGPVLALVFHSVAVVHCHRQGFGCVVAEAGNSDIRRAGEGVLRVRRLVLLHILNFKPTSGRGRGQ